MMVRWDRAIRQQMADSGPIISVTVATVEGSVPREAGAWMLVGNEAITRTIGGGRLELEAIETARRLLNEQVGDWHRSIMSYPLGPSLGQCCGGHVRLLFERFDRIEGATLASEVDDGNRGAIYVRPVQSGIPLHFIADRSEAKGLPLPVAGVASAMLSGKTERKFTLTKNGGLDVAWVIQPVEKSPVPLFLYGAGHVGRAIAKIMEDLPFRITWVDTAKSRFPANLPKNADMLVAVSPADAARLAPADAFHIILTYSHQIDFEICHALLSKNEFGFAGLIGSKTKRARFWKRLRVAGITDDVLLRMTCPIGVGGIAGKEPISIAISVVAQLVQQFELRDEIAPSSLLPSQVSSL